MPTGIPKHKEQPSEQTQRLIEALQDIENRLAEERRKDRARVMLAAFVAKHGLTAADLREVAKRIAAREVGSAAVTSKNAAALARGRKLHDARIAKGLTHREVARRVGVPGNGAVSNWERGKYPRTPKYCAGLIKVLDLPKDFFG